MSELSARNAAATISSERPSSACAASPGCVISRSVLLRRRWPATQAEPRRLAVYPDPTETRTTWPRLPPGERCLPWSILHEAAHARARVLRREQPGEMKPLDPQAGLEIRVQPVVDRLLCRPESHSRPVSVPGHQLAGRLVDIRIRNNLVHEPDREGLGRSDKPASEDDVLRPGWPDEPGQPLCAASSGDQAEQDFRLANLRLLPSDPEIGA